MLQIGGQFLLIHAVVGWSLDFPNGIARQGKLLGNRKAPAIAPNGVYQIARLVVNFKDSSLQ